MLRQFSIDELPQLFNVVRGDMSIVGPRPIVDSEIARYGACFSDYCLVKPGLTGLWQISGRNRVPYDRRVALDSHYARTRSMRGDLVIVLRTVPVVLCGGGC
jgi:lipopolysaccharide/colanic/teichoic acid biosynthesis glycosyltransferase